MIEELAARAVFEAPEIRQDLRVAPAAQAQFAPSVVVASVSANVNLCIDGRRATEGLASRDREASPVQAWFRLAFVVPVVCALRGDFQERDRHELKWMPIFATGLQEQYARLTILGQSVCQYGAGQPAPTIM